MLLPINDAGATQNCRAPHAQWMHTWMHSRRPAQIDMIEETLKWAGVQGVSSMVDVGCGIGGSSRYIISKFPGGVRPCRRVTEPVDGRHCPPQPAYTAPALSCSEVPFP